MKRILFVFAITTIAISSCKKDDDPIQGCTDSTANNYNADATEDDGSCTYDAPQQGGDGEIQIETTPSGQAANDNTSGGVYKGTFIGSTGAFKLVLENDSIYGELTLDGEYFFLTSSLTAQDLTGAISNALFTNQEGTVGLYFSVDADGSNPQVTYSISGHPNIVGVVAKEPSTTLLKVYEGSASIGSETWTVNIVLGEDTVAHSAVSTPSDAWSQEYTYFISGGKLICYSWAEEVPGSWIKDEWVDNFGEPDNTSFQPSIDDNSISGTIGNDNISLTRTL